MSLEQRLALSDLKTGVPWNGTHTEEHRSKLSERNRARVWTPEMRARASASAKARHARKAGDAQ